MFTFLHLQSNPIREIVERCGKRGPECEGRTRVLKLHLNILFLQAMKVTKKNRNPSVAHLPNENTAHRKKILGSMKSPRESSPRSVRLWLASEAVPTEDFIFNSFRI